MAATDKKKDDIAPAMTQSQGSCKLPDLVCYVKVSQPPSDSEACLGCGVLSDKTVSTNPHQADFPVSFHLQSAVELVYAWVLQPETIASRLSVQQRGRIAHNVDNYEN